MMKKLFLVVVAAHLLTGCGIYTKYTRPYMEVEACYRHAENKNDTLAIELPFWRTFFNDTCLQALIEQGLQRNTDLRLAYLRVEEARAALLPAKLAYLPTLALDAEGGWSRYDENLSGAFGISASVGWELDIFGRLTNVKRSARAALEESQAYAQAVRTRMVATIAGYYYTLQMLDCQLEIGEKTLENWEQSIRTLEWLKRAGLTHDAALLQARANLMQLENAVISIRKNIYDTENDLSALLALPSGPIERREWKEVPFSDTLSVGVPVQLLSLRPDIQQAEHQLEQAFYTTNIARAAFYPRLTLSGILGWTNQNGGIITNPGAWLLNTVGSLVQPLFNAQENRARLKIAKVRQQAAELRFRQSLLDAGKEVNQALVQCQSAQRQIELADLQTASLHEAVIQTERLMRHSTSTYLEVLTAQQSLLDAQRQQSQYRLDYIQGMLNLYQALGGWKF